jgi:hypothetical protein
MRLAALRQVHVIAGRVGRLCSCLAWQRGGEVGVVLDRKAAAVGWGAKMARCLMHEGLAESKVIFSFVLRLEILARYTHKVYNLKLCMVGRACFE